MRSTTKLMKNWQFTGPDGKTTAVDLPHTWNNIDGQDGGNDYWRGTCIYKTRFAAPAFDKNTQQVWLQFEGVNASAKVTLNGVEVARHDGGYSTFRADVTALLADSNELIVEADNSKMTASTPRRLTSPSTAASTATSACWSSTGTTSRWITSAARACRSRPLSTAQTLTSRSRPGWRATARSSSRFTTPPVSRW